ncbi:UDP-N-acetylmuramoyl-L-alanyl-D-glutamate--2,6-diaminopimelate ligase [Xenophilus arseniciresistens]|uniref:UDP-N-acetylmuramoyl-L-alanyl-D-glutamate--2,6-diaminopimelate ligase n=1 Tax=Xenophilus arseniciresistens TaxID=1283306 RepID=A0AAE3T1D3_9BURK|nr:UDP-N-acetylmuramoyl-L-alanyl-D-glutamate--2,6-diaminopimelate ligase [Xenophilus arseniciresistens]MDA7417876.1 UDP-N-acetylmuramoyl-L-alanyl-D-glutamate--2,6-diaminopimelate ligase [Xenophilus arseniciresistens]
MAATHAPLEPVLDVQAAVQWLRARGARALRVDSRAVQPGDAFIAWPGAATDGRAYVAAALAQGAVACLVEAEGVDAFDFGSGEGTLAAVACYAGLKAATGPIAAAWCDQPSQALDLLAVTGTNGKTSTAWWLAQALNAGQARPRCALIGTLGVGVPPALTYTGLTTPDPVTLQQSLREFADQGFDACAIEASSIGIVERRLDGTRIGVAVFTNFTQDHLDYHASMDAYWEAKAELFRWPGLRAAVINIDDLRGAALVQALIDRGTRGLDLWTTSAQGRPARLCAQEVGYGSGGLQFTVVEQGMAPVRLATGLTGDYNVANLLGVIGALRARGMALREAVAACADLDSVPGRMERVSAPGLAGPLPMAVVDYAHTPDALDKVLTGLRSVAGQRGGRLWCLFGCGGDRDPLKRPLMAAVAEARADVVVLTSDNPRSESPSAILSQVLRGFARPDAVQVQPERAQAIADALAQAAPQDVVLIAGKGHEAWQEIAGQRLPFSDRAHALAALEARSAA